MFLVTIYNIGSEALDFKAYRHVWLLEPPYHANKVTQAVARTVRECQGYEVEVLNFIASRHERSLSKSNNLVDRIQRLISRAKEAGGEQKEAEEEQDTTGGKRDSYEYSDDERDPNTEESWWVWSP